MRKLILSLLVVASLGACDNNEVGRYQFIEATNKYHAIMDTKKGEVLVMGVGQDSNMNWLKIYNFPKGTIRRDTVIKKK
jgi:hypothetical protein